MPTEPWIEGWGSTDQFGSPPKRILCCGDRDWVDRELIYQQLARLRNVNATIIHGANGIVDQYGKVIRGADKMAAECALELGLRIDKPPTLDNPFGGYVADWDRYHKAAGPIRNGTQLREGHPDVIWAWNDNLNRSRGTRDMIKQGLAVNIPVVLFSHAFPNGQSIHMLRPTTNSPEGGTMPLLPEHPGVCNCDDCNAAYGKRRVK